MLQSTYIANYARKFNPSKLHTILYFNIIVSQASPDWNYDNLPYRPDNNLKYTCNASVISPPPSPVNNFTVVSYDIQQSQIILDLEWYPPAFPDGTWPPTISVWGESPWGPVRRWGRTLDIFVQS